MKIKLIIELNEPGSIQKRGIARRIAERQAANRYNEADIATRQIFALLSSWMRAERIVLVDCEVVDNETQTT